MNCRHSLRLPNAFWWHNGVSDSVVVRGANGKVLMLMPQHDCACDRKDDGWIAWMCETDWKLMLLLLVVDWMVLLPPLLLYSESGRGIQRGVSAPPNSLFWRFQWFGSMRVEKNVSLLFFLFECTHYHEYTFSITGWTKITRAVRIFNSILLAICSAKLNTNSVATHTHTHISCRNIYPLL